MLTFLTEHIRYGVLQTDGIFIMPTTAPNRRTINARVPASAPSQPNEPATATAQTKSFLSVESLPSYLNAQVWRVKEVQQAIVEADSGDFATDEQVNAVFAKYGS